LTPSQDADSNEIVPVHTADPIPEITVKNPSSIAKTPSPFHCNGKSFI